MWLTPCVCVAEPAHSLPNRHVPDEGDHLCPSDGRRKVITPELDMLTLPTITPHRSNREIYMKAHGK
eukprot:1571889-Rhodomonas_salina.1